MAIYIKLMLFIVRDFLSQYTGSIPLFPSTAFLPPSLLPSLLPSVLPYLSPSLHFPLPFSLPPSLPHYLPPLHAPFPSLTSLPFTLPLPLLVLYSAFWSISSSTTAECPASNSFYCNSEFSRSLCAVLL